MLIACRKCDNGEHQFINLLHTSPSILSSLPLALAVPVTVSETRHFVNCLHPNNSEEDQSRFRFIFTKTEQNGALSAPAVHPVNSCCVWSVPYGRQMPELNQISDLIEVCSTVKRSFNVGTQIKFGTGLFTFSSEYFIFSFPTTNCKD
jgi:hypothetical protein